MHTAGSGGSNRISVDIWEDVVCPWCYIGKRRFEPAAGSFTAKGLGERREVDVEFHSFTDVAELGGHRALDRGVDVRVSADDERCPELHRGPQHGVGRSGEQDAPDR
jgi:predicted DsbA family dithiol-disulfide isomerase